MTHRRRPTALRQFAGTALIAGWVLGLAACSEDKKSKASGEEAAEACEVDTSYAPAIDPADFTVTIANPYFPLTPGTAYTYQGAGETVAVTVTNDTRVILGVTTRVVRDTVTKGGQVIEDTYDWYAQRISDGSVWYFGEDTTEYEDGAPVSKEGSWESGVDGAQPGTIMPKDSAFAPGFVYRQEYSPCNAEDAAEVVAIGETVSVPYNTSIPNCRRTRDYTPLDPMANEYKWYCPGIGFTAEVDIWTGNRIELTGISP